MSHRMTDNERRIDPRHVITDTFDRMKRNGCEQVVQRYNDESNIVLLYSQDERYIELV